MLKDKHIGNADSGHWTDIARVWKQVGPPLRPSVQDIAFLENEISAWKDLHGTPRALILGVTPELYNLRWPEGTSLSAVDHNQNMIDCVWPGPKNKVVCSEWTAMPLEAGSRDIVLCDGGLHLLAYPEEQGKLAENLGRILSLKGLCFMRLFVPPAEHETPGDVIKELMQGKIANLNLLKLRLGMALQTRPGEGVQLSHVWDFIYEAEPDFARLASSIGWDIEHLLAVNSYRNSGNKYYFVGVEEVANLFCKNPGGFEMQKAYTPDYELGGRCPTVVLRRV